nr:PREDICTED: F-box only protein 15 isoform X2 [Latimeria chalumnae]|eukprot:XP_014340882.1 PREDICTED: F-box only protein 15 isoform X2 [Latimeria chalumnae]
MATGRGRILQKHSIGVALMARARSCGSAGALIYGEDRACVSASSAPDCGQRELFRMPVMCNRGHGTKKPSNKKPYRTRSSKPWVSIESLPSEILLKIFSYLDVASLLCAGCVNKRFNQLANDNAIWFKIYSSSGSCQGKKWTPAAELGASEALRLLSIQEKPAGHWKKECVKTLMAGGKKDVGQILKPINPYTGLPAKTKEAVKALSVGWTIILKDKRGREHAVEQAKVYYASTCAVVCWIGVAWPPLGFLTTLQLYGVMPVILEPCRLPSKNGPRRRSLLAEYDLTRLKESSRFVGGDALVKLLCLHPGLLLALWKAGSGIAFIMATLHFHHLIERSTLGSATRPYALPLHMPVLDDIDPGYGLHGYQLHLDMHCGLKSYMSGNFRQLFCTREPGRFFLEYIRNGFLRLNVIAYKNVSQHIPVSGKVGIFWKTEVFEGTIQNCFILDVTVLDEAEKPFWCISSPVSMQAVVKQSALYDYMGQSYMVSYSDTDGKIYMELVWMEESEQYYILNLVLYLSAEKVNHWFGTNY